MEELSNEEIRVKLLQIRAEFRGFGNFTIHTMSKVERRAREIKILVVNALGKDNEIFGRMDQCIEISEKYHKKHLGLEHDIIKEALISLEYGIELFLDRI